MKYFKTDHKCFGSSTSWQIMLFTISATLIAYTPAIQGPFFSDDYVYLVGNQDLLSIPLSEFWKFFLSRTNPYEYLPLRDLSYRIDAAMWGVTPLGFHLHNLLLYATCCLFVWLLTAEICRLVSPFKTFPNAAEIDQQTWICTLTTCIFAVHPAHVEAVAWISGRKDLLSGLFAFASIWQFTKGINQTKLLPLHLLASYFLFACALLSKSAVISLPAIFFLLAYVSFRDKNSPIKSTFSSCSIVLPLLLLSLASLLITQYVGCETGVKESLFVQEILKRDNLYFQAIRILALLAQITFLPFWPKLIYVLPETGLSLTIAGLGVLVAALLGSFFWCQRKSLIGFGIAVFPIICLPFLQIIPFKTWSLVSDRFIFVASYSLILAVSALLIRLDIKQRKIISFLIIMSLFLVTANQASKWRSSTILMIDTARKAPSSFDAQMMVITNVYLPDKMFKEAELAAQGLKSPFNRKMISSFVRANSALASGDLQEAQDLFGPFIQFIDSSNYKLMPLCGILAEKNGKYSDAAKFYYNYLHKVYMSQKREQAELDLQRVRGYFTPQFNRLRTVIETDPTNIAALGTLANLELEVFLLDEAIEKYKKILRQKPGLPVAHYNLGLAFSAKHEYKKAIKEIQKAIAGGLLSADILNNLAIAYKKTTDFDGAKATFLKAISLEPDNLSVAINLSKMYLALNDNEKAKKILLDVMEKTRNTPDLAQTVRLIFQGIN